ncbi:MAG: membrane protein insertase YidC [Gammaproteobacteria bacterium]
MDNPRLLLFIALSFLVMIMWQTWQQDYQQTKTGEQAVVTETTGTPAQTGAGGNDLPSIVVEERDAPLSVESPAIPQGKRIQVMTDLMHLEIDTQGGDVRVVKLLGYPESTEPESPPFTMLTDRNHLFIAQSGLRSGKKNEPNHYARFTATAESYQLQDNAETLEIPLVWNDGGITVTKLFRLRRNSYEIDVEFIIENQGSADWLASSYFQLQRNRPENPGGVSAFAAQTYTGGVIYSPEEKYEKISFDDMEDENLNRNISGGWLAMIEHYFLAAWVPEENINGKYYSRVVDGDRYVLGYVGKQTRVSPGSQQTVSSRLYAGPKDQDKLASIATGLDLTVDYGILTFISQPLFWLLEKIHGIVNNWGWAIIILTMLIKLVFFKLSEASYKSMANMRKLAPRLKSLKERYGDDKQKLNQAMMDMYKTEKINPLGGCLPVLVQIPVFIALYWVLLESVELRQAPFMLWLKDLSVADPYFVLPLIMGVTMLIQQKLNPAPMDPIQAKVMMVLPIVFTVFFAFFPAGLVLYWVVNNTLSIAQQWVITKRVEAGEA